MTCVGNAPVAGVQYRLQDMGFSWPCCCCNNCNNKPGLRPPSSWIHLKAEARAALTPGEPPIMRSALLWHAQHQAARQQRVHAGKQSVSGNGLIADVMRWKVVLVARSSPAADTAAALDHGFFVLRGPG
jgi:hypothetical protein